MKKMFKNWKFSIIVLLLIVIFNIVFLCQPVYGIYRGTTTYSGWYSESYETKIQFDDGYAQVVYSRNYNGKQQVANNVGIYQRVDDKIIIISFLTNPDESDLDTRKRIFTRNSVFSLSNGENIYTSKGSVFLQIGFAIVEIILLVRFVVQFKSRNTIKKELDD
ncbi:MAG: hypothetical protein IJA15_04245 [Clostridia bacterium]|nr:hypothetical protein [Clostridia bacterium]